MGMKIATDGKPPAEGHEGTGAPQPIDPATGQHRAYWILSDEDRAKGFVRPLRRTYVHSALGPKYPLRDLTTDETERYSEFGYVKFEPYPPNDSSVTGRFWTQEQIDRIGKCGVATTMGQKIAETYAVDPKFYGSTFCVGCKTHFPVDQFRWDDGSVLGS